jgi:hypothetical protein
VNVKVYVVSTAEGLLKLNSNTAGLPSVAEAGLWLQDRIIIIDCSSSRSGSRDNSKAFSSAIVSAVVGTETVPVVAQVQLLFEVVVSALPAVPLVNVKVYVVSTAEGLLKLNSNTGLQ